MEVAGTWNHKKPILKDLVKVFMSRAGYFGCPHKYFSKVSIIPNMKKWLENEEDAHADVEVWGDKRASYKSLQEILMSYSGKKEGKK